MRKSLSGNRQEKYSASAVAEASAPKPAWAFVCLAVAALTLPFANERWLVPVAAWIGSLFFVRFLRQQPRMRALILGSLVMIGLSLFCWNGILSIPGIGYDAVAAVLGVYSFCLMRWIVYSLPNSLVWFRHSSCPLPLWRRNFSIRVGARMAVGLRWLIRNMATCRFCSCSQSPACQELLF